MRIGVADEVSMSSLFGDGLRDMSGTETSVYYIGYINVSSCGGPTTNSHGRT
jgi:hypothetical protein